MKPQEALCRGSFLAASMILSLFKRVSRAFGLSQILFTQGCPPDPTPRPGVRAAAARKEKGCPEGVDRFAYRRGWHPPAAIKKSVHAINYSRPPFLLLLILPFSIHPAAHDSGHHRRDIADSVLTSGTGRNHGTGMRSSASATSRESRSSTRPWASASSSKPGPDRASETVVR